KDGLETINHAKPDDYIVKNQTDAAELYIVKQEKFMARYAYFKDAPDDFTEYYPTGKVIAIELSNDFLREQDLAKEFYFEAPWGEPVIAKENDFLVMPPDQSEIYRIARKEFFETYELM
ncbi:MAG: hypothetical protein AAFZ15_32555, partial [Bacteroidota bacterium]